MTVMSIGKTYRFNTRSPNLLGASLINVKLVGAVDYERARLLDNIDVRHRAIYPSLPPGTPDRAADYTYYQFKTQSGGTIVLADAWIDMSTIEIVEHINFNVQVEDANLSDMQMVSNLLATTGLKFKVSQN